MHRRVGIIFLGFHFNLRGHVLVKHDLVTSVKCLLYLDKQVSLLSRVRHKNLVELVGYCIENNLVLVYEFMSEGSLFDALFGKHGSISIQVHSHFAIMSFYNTLTSIYKLVILLFTSSNKQEGRTILQTYNI